MITFMDLPSLARAMFNLWFCILLFISCVVSFRLFAQKTYILAIAGLIISIINYIIVQWFSDISICYNKGIYPTHSPYLIKAAEWYWFIIIGIVLTAASISLFVHTVIYGKGHITTFSIKEGIDNIPTGLCWYYDDGTLALRNSTMEDLYKSLSRGKLLDSGYELVDLLKKHMDINSVVETEDGKVLNIRFGDVIIDNMVFHEVSAYNLTEEYKVTRTLEKKKKEAEKVNENLIKYGRELAEMITAKEILAAKVRIHDELGHGLLLTRKYLLRGGDEDDKKKLLEVLRKNNILMENSITENEKTYFDMILEAADDMGINVEIEGDIPESEDVNNIITTAIHENLTNTIRHAQGDRLWISITKTEDIFTVEFTNNGNPPSGPIEERGGLKTLRSLVEAASGDMTIEFSPAYKMILHIVNAK